jgi:CPA1 family monovalent cation:H+ antiporter
VADPVAWSPVAVVSLVIFLSFLGAILSNRVKASYPTVIIAIGLALSILRVGGELQSVPFDSTVILGFVVPPMIFEAAMRTRLETFRTVEKTVISLAIFGVVISAIITGLVLNIFLGLPLAAALMFGIIISPTDPVSVVNVLKRVRAPERLTTILESEAYLNNATPVMLYGIAVSLSFSTQSLGLFAYSLLGGVAVGLVVSGAAELLHRLITEPLAETSFTIAVMFGSYALAESLGMSGLIAVPIAGLFIGNRTMRTAMSEETRTTMTRFWEVMTFLATSFAFLLIGLKADFGLLIKYAPFIMAAFLVILIARIFSVYPIIGLTNLIGEGIPRSWTNVIAFAGFRGAVSVALALSLPESSFKNTIVSMTFGVALLSLVVQAEIMQVYVKTIELISNDGNRQQPITGQPPDYRPTISSKP